MCGCICFPVQMVPNEELLQYYNLDEIAGFEKNGSVISAFWQKKPVLPVQQGEQVRLCQWGNREKDSLFPKTGWAREESLKLGKWKRLHPETIRIPADRGCEKKVWFDTKDGISGILVRLRDEERVYMVTRPATPDYLQLTGHDRMPAF